MTMFDRRQVLAAIGASLVPMSAARAATYPASPIKVIVPFAAGGTGDLVLRLLGRTAETSLGQRLVLENVAGAGGNIGTQSVVRSDPNGYTLLCGATNNFVINQYLFRLSFDPLKDLVPIFKLAEIPSILYSNPSVPAKTIGEFIKYSKKNPNTLSFSSPGIGTTPHLSVERLKQITGLNIQHIPYPGAAQAIQALLTNEVQLYLAGASVGMAFVPKGEIRALAVGSTKRLPSYPDIPTASETGVPDYTASNWFALAAPRNTPAAIVDVVQRAFIDGLADPTVQDRFRQLGYLEDRSSPNELVTTFSKEASYWSDTIKPMGLRPQ